MKLFICCILIGYLFGCINGSQIIGYYKNIDIKKSGSRNAGASNTTMLLGLKYGVVVGLIDVFKAIFSIFLITTLLNRYGIINEAQIIYIYLNALFVVVGHNYPVTMNFNGGKGTASFIGTFFMINWKIAFIGLLLLMLLALITDYFVIGTLSMYLSFVGFTYYSFGYVTFLLALIIFSLSVLKHLENYQRIMNKKEIKLSSLLRREAS